MAPFWNRQKPDPTLEARIASLELELQKSVKLVRTALDEVAELSTRVYRNLKATEARARREADSLPAANQDRSSGVPLASSEGTPPPVAPSAWGARARIAARRARATLPVGNVPGMAAPQDETNGVHS